MAQKNNGGGTASVEEIAAAARDHETA